MFQLAASSFWEKIIETDIQLFKLINGKLINPFFDNVLPWWRDSLTWVPLYLFILAFLFLNIGKKTRIWLYFALVNVTLTDQLSSSVVKNFFQRLRPCNDPFLFGEVRLLLNHCSGGYSFTSSHATNHFGFAMFAFLTLQPFFNKYTKLFFLWAATISYAQVYVGVHYPLDILGGTVLGLCIGWLNGRFFNRRVGLLIIN